ncbi:hypothetical protein G3578_09215 [Brevibacillus sp. SYP-B805]|uniref:hypothetical protein n=1 Tax=Brevibacillus sp. SYP-B805 TaxID=1578199 RepID=UPI0013ED291A|nr:hypothetical protein [Brevibacillus sp. SYP-B805]NGQ95333.1 hypothetical protein [Brevibacillus sp. SYP-B805]
MEIKLTAKFCYKSSKESVSLSWVEKNPKIIQKKKDSDEVLREITLTVEGVKQEYRKLLVNYKNEGKAFSVQDVNGKIHLIDMTEVKYIELDAAEIEGGKEAVTAEVHNAPDDTQFSPQSSGTNMKKKNGIVEALGVKPKRHTLN